MYFLSDGCGDITLHAHFLCPASLFPSLLRRFPPHHSPQASPRRDWWDLGGLQKSSSLWKSSLCEQGSCSKLSKGAEGQPCLMYSTIFLFVLHLLKKDIIVYERQEDCGSQKPAEPTLGAVPSSLHLLPLEPCHGPKFGLFTEPED